MSIASLCSPPAYVSYGAHLAQIPYESCDQHPPTMSNGARTQLGHTLATTDYRPPPPAGPADEDVFATMPTLRKHRRDCNALLPPDEFDERTKTWKHVTGFRKDLTVDKLTMPDAPTRKKRPSATFPRRTATPAAARYLNGLTKPLAVSSSRHGGSGESANEEEDELVNVGTDNDGSATMIDLDLEEEVRLEKKRRQNTQAARRSRIRKAEEVQKLQDRVAELEAEVIAGQHRLAQAECGASRLGGVFVCYEGAICCRCFGTRRAFTAHPNGVCISQPRDYGALLGTPTVASSFTIAPSCVPTVSPVPRGERNISGHPPYLHPHCIGCAGPHGARAHGCLTGREVLRIPRMRARHQRSSWEDRTNLTIPTTRDRSRSDSEGSSRSASTRRK